MEISINDLYNMEIYFCHTWLKNGCDYTTGVEFYSQFGTNETLKKLFARGKTNFNCDKLKCEIELLAKKNPEVYFPGPIKKKINRSELPDFLLSDFDKLGPLIQTISYHHSRLDLIQNDLDRYNTAAIILNAAESRRSIFQRIDYYFQHGKDLIKKESSKIPEVKVFSEDKAIRALQLKEELRLLRSQRSKLKTKPTRIADYNQVITRIGDIEKELNNES